MLAIIAAIEMGAQHTQSPPAFKAGVELVQVDLTVLDRHRVPVDDLAFDEVTVLENGKPRPIVVFSRIDVGQPESMDGGPSTTEMSAERASGTVHTSSPEAERRYGRLVAIMFDRSIPAGAPTMMARDIALAVIQSLGPGDEAAVVRSSRFTGDGLSQAFTTDRAQLMRAVLSSFTGQVAMSEMTRTAGDTIGGLADAKPDQLTTGDCMCGLCTLDAIMRVSEAVRDIRDRRKLLVWIGADIVVESQVGGCSARLRRERTRLFRELDLSNLTVHVVDPSGLQTRQLDASSKVRASGAMTSQSQTRQYELDRQSRLPILPDRTGGRTIMNVNVPAEQIPDMLGESRIFYILGFEPANQPSDGRFRKLEVKVARRGVTVQARRGYVTSAGSH